jgi:DNA polymerase III subunit epsilon
VTGHPVLPQPDAAVAGDGDLLRSLEYVVVDVETTGGSAYRGDRVTEVAALVVTGTGTVLEEFQTLIDPERPIPSFITRITNITNGMVRGAPRFFDIAPEIQRLLAGRVFVAHNAPFDRGFLDAELRRATGSGPEGRTLCTVRLARKVVPEVASRSLDALSYYFALDNEARHRAMGDARVTLRLLDRLLERLEEREIARWTELEAFMAKRAVRRRRRATPTSIDEI